MNTAYSCKCGASVIKAGEAGFCFEDKHRKLCCTVENEQLKFRCNNCDSVICFPFPILAREGLTRISAFMSEYEEDSGKYAPQAVVDIVRQIIESFTLPSKNTETGDFKTLSSPKYEVLKEGAEHPYKVLSEPGEEKIITSEPGYYPIWVGLKTTLKEVTRIVNSTQRPESEEGEFFTGPFNVQILTKPDEKPVKPTGKTYKYKKKEKPNHSLQELRETHLGAAWGVHGKINEDGSPSWNQSQFRWHLLNAVGALYDYFIAKEKNNAKDD